MKNILLTVIITALSLTVSADDQGDGPNSYNYLNGGYQWMTYSGGPGAVLDDSNGFYTNLMVEPAEAFLLNARFLYAKPDLLGGIGSAEFYDLKLGGGMHFPIGDMFDFYTVIGGRYYKNGLSGVDLSFDDWGFYVEPGIRAAFTSNFEIYLSGTYSYISSHSAVGGEVGAVFYLTPNFGVEVIGSASTLDSAGVGVGARIAF